MTLYADDTILYSCHANMDFASAKIQLAVKTLHKWCQLNRPNINLGNTKIMMVYKDRTASDDLPIIRVDNKPPGNGQSFNYLRVWADDLLSFDKFVEGKIQ